MTKAELAALQAVAAGLVVQRFDADGNVFTGPPGISPRNYRKFERAKWIEDVPRQPHGRYFVQQLTAAGKAALASTKDGTK